jgi:uncharacterized DUF497 family protein
MALEFEWDSAKADANLKEHGVCFDEATTVFRDALSITISDPGSLRFSRSLYRYRHVSSDAIARGIVHRAARKDPNHKCPTSNTG